MFAITESNRVQLEQFHFIQSALLTYKMLIHKGEYLQQREQILQKKEVSCFNIYTYTLKCQPEKGKQYFVAHSILCPQLACKSVKFLIGQLLISVVDACFSSSEC